jgi:hypothetical protein
MRTGLTLASLLVVHTAFLRAVYDSDYDSSHTAFRDVSFYSVSPMTHDLNLLLCIAYIYVFLARSYAFLDIGKYRKEMYLNNFQYSKG